MKTNYWDYQGNWAKSECFSLANFGYFIVRNIYLQIETAKGYK